MTGEDYYKETLIHGIGWVETALPGAEEQAFYLAVSFWIWSLKVNLAIMEHYHKKNKKHLHFGP